MSDEPYRPPGRHPPLQLGYYEHFDTMEVGQLRMFSKGEDGRPSHGFFHQRALKLGWRIKMVTLDKYFFMIRIS